MKLLKNSIIIPLIGTMDSFTGGLCTSDGQFIEDSVVERGRVGQLQKHTEYLHGTYIYGGCLFDHFGHFIWESLSRLYAIRQFKNYPILFITPNTADSIKKLNLFFKSIGVTNEIRLIKVQTAVENLIYSSPGSSINPLYITDEQINSLKCIKFSNEWGRVQDSKEKIWLSRSNLPHKLMGCIINEEIIEKILMKNGYKIISPEYLSLQEQVQLISTSDIISGFDGSQFFTLLFAEEISSKFYVFNRRPKIPSTIPYVFQKRNVEFELYHFDVEYVAGEGAWSYYNHPHPEKIIEILMHL